MFSPICSSNALAVGPGPASNQAARVADLLLELVVADPAGGFLQLARRVALVAPELGRGRVDLPLEVGDLLFHLALLLQQAAQRVEPRLVLQARKLLHLGAHLALLVGQAVGAPQLIGDVALQPAPLLAVQPLLHLAQPVERRPRLGESEVVVVGGGPAHRVGRFLQPARRVHHLRRVLLAREALEAPRRFFRLVGQGPLSGPAALR